MMNKKNYEMTLMERIDFIRANSVTEEEFRKMWGYSIDDFSERMTVWMEKWDAELEKLRPDSPE